MSLKEKIFDNIALSLPIALVLGGSFLINYPSIVRGRIDEKIQKSGRIEYIQVQKNERDGYMIKGPTTIMDIDSNGSPDYVYQRLLVIGPMAGHFPGLGYDQGFDLRKPTSGESELYKNTETKSVYTKRDKEK